MPCSKVPLFDDLVDAQQECLGDFKAERLRGGQIDDELEFGQLLYRDVGGFGSAQDLVDKLGGAPVKVEEVCFIGHQPCRFDVPLPHKHGRQTCRQGQSADTDSVCACKRV